jgi:endonuclease/exonuclease/phosphatase family metal-dependent hydrolase
MELTVATFNIRTMLGVDGTNAWPFRARACAEAIASLHADVVGLQEAYRCQLRSVHDYEWYGKGRRGGHRGEHTPVLSRLPATGDVTRWYDVPGSRFPRIATTVSFAGFHFTSTHFDESSTQRRNESARQLRAWLDEAPGPHVVVGDFNAEANASLFEILGLVRADPGPSGTTHHFRGNTDGRQIDHVLVTPDIEILDAHVAHPRPRGRLPSDHWPVVARLRVPS